MDFRAVAWSVASNSMGNLRALVLTVIGACCLSCVRIVVDNQTTSPDGRYVAAVFRADPGAMSDFTSVVTLRRSSESFSRMTGEVFATRGSYPIEVIWISAKELLIECLECEQRRIEMTRSQWKDLGIRYSTRSSVSLRARQRPTCCN